MRLAVISDVHGNALALEAVLADIAGHAPDVIVNLGDHLSGPFEPGRCADILMEAGFPSVRGNHDRMLMEARAGADHEQERLAADRLTEAHWRWLEELPATRVLEDRIFMCHATPHDDTTGWLDDFNAEFVMAPAPRRHVEKQAAGFDYELMLCGHTHVPRIVQLSGNRLGVNPGSVGYPGFRSGRDPRIAWSAGAPHARYALLDEMPNGWDVDFRAVTYDFEAAARQADGFGWQAQASAMRTGWI